MKPELRPGLRRQERGQAATARVDQHGDAAFGERADLAQRQRDHVGGEGNRLAHGSCRPTAPRPSRRRSADCRTRRSPRSASVAAACRSRSSTAPITCGWQRRQYGSCTRSSPIRCEARMALPAISARNAARDLDLAAMAAQRWMRGSNGVSEPRAASVDSAPVSSAGLEQALGLEQAGQRVGGGELRAVEQRQALLRRPVSAAQSGMPPTPARPACARRDASPRLRRSSPRSCGRAARDRPMRRRTLGRHDRHQVVPRASLPAVARSPAARRTRPVPRLASLSASISRTTAAGVGLAHAGRMGQHDIALQDGQIVRLDPDRRQTAEAGVDAINRFAREKRSLRSRVRRVPPPACRPDPARGPHRHGSPASRPVSCAPAAEARCPSEAIAGRGPAS